MEQIGEGHPLAFSDENVVSLTALGSRRADQLARIAEAGLVEEGRVFLLSLEAVRLEMGARWEMRREIVWETFERDLTRAMPAPDVFIRLDDTTILAAIGTTDGYSGQVRCAQILRSALEFFLGRNQESDLSISRVSALGPEGVSASRSGQPSCRGRDAGQRSRQRQTRRARELDAAAGIETIDRELRFGP